MGFFKFHESMLDSSVNDQPCHVRWCWAALLALASADSVMRVPIGAFCRRANLRAEEVNEALEYLQRPDPTSRCQDHDGRRVVAVDGGLLLVALRSFRESKHHDDLRRRQAEWVAAKRSKHKPVDDVSTECRQPVDGVSTACRSDVDDMSTDCRSLSTLSTHTEAEAEAEADKPLPLCVDGVDTLAVVGSPAVPSDQPTKKRRGHRMPKPSARHHPEAEQMVRRFREDFCDNVDREYDFGPGAIPASELEAATRWLDAAATGEWPPEKREALIDFFMGDRIPREPRVPGQKPFPGWAHVIRSVAKFWEKRDTLWSQREERRMVRRAKHG